MDGQQPSIAPQDLYARLGTAASPIVIDVRRPADFATADSLITSAFHRSPEEVEEWLKDVPGGRPIVAYCVHGHKVSQGVTAVDFLLPRLRIVARSSVLPV